MIKFEWRYPNEIPCCAPNFCYTISSHALHSNYSLLRVVTLNYRDSLLRPLPLLAECSLLSSGLAKLMHPAENDLARI